MTAKSPAVAEEFGIFGSLFHFYSKYDPIFYWLFFFFFAFFSWNGV